jgi:hypothetical protein
LRNPFSKQQGVLLTTDNTKTELGLAGLYTRDLAQGKRVRIAGSPSDIHPRSMLDPSPIDSKVKRENVRPYGIGVLIAPQILSPNPALQYHETQISLPCQSALHLTNPSSLARPQTCFIWHWQLHTLELNLAGAITWPQILMCNALRRVMSQSHDIDKTAGK